MDGVQRGARLGFPIFMPLQSAAKSYRPMAESSSQPTVTNLVPSKQKCLGATPQTFIKAESDVLRTLDTTYGSVAFIWHLTPIISVSLTKLTRAYCRCGNDNALTKRKARAGSRGPFARHARRQVRSTKQGRHSIGSRHPHKPMEPRLHLRSQNHSTWPQRANASTNYCRLPE